MRLTSNSQRPVCLCLPECWNLRCESLFLTPWNILAQDKCLLFSRKIAITSLLFCLEETCPAQGWQVTTTLSSCVLGWSWWLESTSLRRADIFLWVHASPMSKQNICSFLHRDIELWGDNLVLSLFEPILYRLSTYVSGPSFLSAQSWLFWLASMSPHYCFITSSVLVTIPDMFWQCLLPPFRLALNLST